MKFFSDRFLNLALCLEDYDPEWATFLFQQFKRDYMLKLDEALALRTNIIYPHKEHIFSAFKLTKFEDVRVVILGQDPYIHENQAHGLSFSTLNGSTTPSLNRIKEAINGDVTIPFNNNLTRWAEQGVFLINAVMTVDKGVSDSHKDLGWEEFTKEVIRKLDESGKVIFLLWGAKAQKLDDIIQHSMSIKCEHPQYANYQHRKWINKDCFNKVNNLIKGDKIIWQ